MRLINIDTLEFAEFYDDAIPAYAILSHRWTTDELTYADFRKGRRKESIGYEKVLRFQEVTQRYNAWLQHGSNEATRATPSAIRHLDGPPWVHPGEISSIEQAWLDLRFTHERPQEAVKYMWLDTCCIDKRSSAELSEAINAMYSYYSNAQICFAHLADVHAAEIDRDSLAPEVERMMHDSVWFTRGCLLGTLQEMIAPERMLFCDDDWTFFAHKCRGILVSGSGTNRYCNELPSSYHVNELIAKITGVTLRVIDSVKPDYARYGRHQVLFDKPTALEIFGWASERTTSRVEDMSYCLLGLLGINMPLLYGEGLLAFRRLQEAIMVNTSDETFLAFHSADPYRKAAPILAKGPRDFVCVSSWTPRNTASVLLEGSALGVTPLSSKTIANGTLQFTTEALRLHGPRGVLTNYTPEYWLVPVSVFVQAGNDKHAARMHFAVVLELSAKGSSRYHRVSNTRLPNNIYNYVVNIGESFYIGSDWHICRWRRVRSYLKRFATWSAQQQTFAIDLTPQDYDLMID
ncbi:hypothetical protein LTR27_010263 [Elasticomyces elasticus]|nr:hypothetical protein LTR27_010263 [Elasticomyces elasticus]